LIKKEYPKSTISLLFLQAWIEAEVVAELYQH
jgi:hypothetical protein